MKKIRVISVLLAIMLTFSAIGIYNVCAASRLTDANTDGKFNSKDVLLTRKYIAKMKVDIDLTAADVNLDKTVNSKDVLMMRRALAGQIKITEPSETETVKKKYIALTFDDGPNTYSTPTIISRLKQKKIVATFFLIGCNINDETAAVAKQALANGNEIANHSYSHTYMDTWTAEQIKEDIAKTDELINKHLGVTPKFFRAPFLATSKTMYDNINKVFIAGVGADDWQEGVTEEQITERLLGSVTDGTIILLHDSQSKNANTISYLVPKLKEQGYEFVTLSELFRIKGIDPKEYPYTTFSAL